MVRSSIRTQKAVQTLHIPNEIFEKIGIKPIPFKLTETMGWHVYDHHAKEAKLKDISDAIDFVLSVINNVDHVRLGRDNSYIFSVENGRERTGKRAISILLGSSNGDYYGIVSSGYEGVERLNRRPLLWAGSAVIAPATDAATVSVTSRDAQKSSEQSGGASDLSNVPSASEDTTSEEEMQESAQENADKAQEIDAASTAQQAEEQVREAEAQTDTNPTEAQKEAGNYRKGHVTIDGLDISIEQPRGSVRSGKDKDGKKVTIRKNIREKGKKIADKNWVLTAYDLSASDGSSAITTTNQGEAAPATDKSASKDTAKTSDSQEDEKKRTEKDKGNTSNFDFDEIEELKDAPRSVRTAIRDYAVNAYNRAILKVPAFQFGIPEEKQERMTFEKFRDEFNDDAEIFAKGTEKYLPAVYEYINKQLDAKRQEKTEEKTQDVQDKTKQNDSEGKQEEKKPQKPTSNRKKTKTKSDLIDELGQPTNVREWIMRSLYRREYKFIWDSNGKTKGLGQHLGLADSKAERKNHFWMLAGKDKGGMYPESVAEAMTEQINDDLGLTGEARVNSIDVLNELLDVVGSYSSQSRLFDAIFDIHKGIEDGISDEEAEYLGNESLAKSWGFDSFAEYEQYRDAVEQLAGMNELSEDEYTELQSLYYDCYYGQENDGRVQEGNDVLSGEQTDSKENGNRGGSEQRGNAENGSSLSDNIQTNEGNWAK